MPILRGRFLEAARQITLGCGPRFGRIALMLLALALLAGQGTALAQAVRTDSGFQANTFPANDDNSVGPVPLGFNINFFGTTYNNTFVNNNGNITFDGPLFDYTPEGLIASTRRIIAAFWADVDTLGAGSSPVRFGQSTVNGRPAFGVNYVNVGYYEEHTDKLNSFQIVLIDRFDTGVGNFDIELNYDRILWDRGDVEVFFNGPAASVGYSNGSGSAATSLEIAGSLQVGAFLDSNPNGLIHRMINSNVPGRLVFQVRNGVISCTYSINPASASFSASGGNGSINVGAQGGCAWTATTGSSFITINSGASGNGNGTVSYSVAANAGGSSRNGTINVAGNTFAVNQSSGAGSTPMSLSPLTLEFTGAPGSGSQSMAVRIASSSGSVNWGATATPLNGSGWLSLGQQSGTVSQSVPFILSVTVNFASLSDGLYQGVVAVRDTATNVTFTVQVLVSVSSLPGRLELSQTAIFFQAAVGGSAPPGQVLRVFNQGTGNMQWSIPPGELPSNPQWLSLSQQAGVSAGGSSSATTMTVNPTGLAAGVYQVLLPVNAGNAADAPRLLSVTLLVAGVGTAPRAELSPSGFAFGVTQGGPPPNPQNLTISNSGAGGLTFTLTPSTTSGISWLQISQGFGSTSLGPQTIQVTVNHTIVTPGIHRGKITVSFSSGGTQEIEVVLVLAPAAALTLQRELPEALACAAQTMDFVMTSIGNGASLPVSFPRALLAQVVNNCGEPVNGATVVSSVEGQNIVLHAVGGGLYNGNWTPERESAAVPVSVLAAHPSFPSVQRSFSVATSAASGGVLLPVLAPNGVVDGAGFTTLRPLAPGSIISVFGSRFAAGDNFVTVVPLTRQLGGVRVRIGNEDAPLYYAGPGQINAQVPVTARMGDSVSIAVTANGRTTAPQQYLIAPAQPGIFKAGEFAAVLDANFAQINAGNPARIADTIQIFANGLGLTSEAVTTGAAAPPFSTVLNPVSVLIGGIEVPVVYQGWAPGFVGLHQVNVVLTSGVPTGSSVAVVVRQNGVESNPSLPVSIPIQ